MRPVRTRRQPSMTSCMSINDHGSFSDPLAPHSGPSIGRRARVKAATPCGVPALTLRAPASSRPSMGSQGAPCLGNRGPFGRCFRIPCLTPKIEIVVDRDHGLAGILPLTIRWLPLAVCLFLRYLVHLLDQLSVLLEHRVAAQLHGRG